MFVLVFAISVTNTLELRSAQIFPKGAQKRQFFLFLKSAQFWGVVWSKAPKFKNFYRIIPSKKVKYWGIKALRIFFQVPQKILSAPLPSKSAHLAPKRPI